MRVTNKMLSNNYLSDMNTNLQNLKTLQQQMSTGKNFSKPSDDPFNVARSMQMHSQINANTQYNKNITNVINWMDTTDTALGQLGNVFQSVREKLVSAGNAAYGSDERQKIKDEINQRVGQIGQILNTSFDGEYIFGGTRGSSKPVDSKQDYSVAKSNTSGGDISISGTPTSADNTSYKITVAGVDASGNITSINYSESTDGTTWTANAASTVDPNTHTFSIDGMTMKIDPNLNTVANDTYTFSTIKNTKLIYANSDGSEIKTFPDVTSETVTPTNWSGQQITFNINGVDAQIQPLGTFSSASSIDDVVADINKQINAYQNSATPPVNVLQGKFQAEKTTDGKIKFTSLTNDIISIKNTTLPASEFSAGYDNKTFPSNVMNMIAGKKKTEISQGVLIDYNVSATDIMNFNNGDNISKLLTRIANHLDGKSDDGTPNDANATSKLTNQDLKDLDAAMSQILKVRSEVGAKQNRMDSAKDQNEQAKLDMTDILSKTEDIDITEKTMEYANMQTVYLASLQTSAKVIQPTLMDYMR